MQLMPTKDFRQFIKKGGTLRSRKALYYSLTYAIPLSQTCKETLIAFMAITCVEEC